MRLRLLFLALFLACASVAFPVTPSHRFAVLVFSKTAGFRHDSIPAGIAAIRSLGAQNGFAVVDTEDAAVFTDSGLAKFRVVIFLSTTGDILDAGQQAAFERFIRRGGGFAGIHSATDTEYDWPWYGNLVGAYFDNHPAIQQATARVAEPNHPSTATLPPAWQRSDEWYNFRDDPSPRVKVLLTLDEKTYSGGTMGERHPISWYHEYDGGRAWYTAMGHTIESYAEPLYLAHILGGIMWAAHSERSDVEQGSVRSGYILVTADRDSTLPSTTVTFGLMSNKIVQAQAGVISQPLTADASVFVDVLPSSGRDVGVAVANPWNSANTITLTLRNSDGTVAGAPLMVSIESQHQIAKLVTELFPAFAGTGFLGTLRVQSSMPSSIVGLRFFGAAFSALSVANSGTAVDIPSRALLATFLTATPSAGDVGGIGANMFPQVAMGGGWLTQVSMVNSGMTVQTGRIDVFDTAGNPMPVEFNDLFQSTFRYSLPAGGAALFATRD